MRTKYTATRAIVMAAGIGQRMRPVTYHTPKPLVSVNGTRMIDTVINALHANGINEIYIVVGYLKEKFKSLPEQYPGVVLIENPYYDTCNNISSLYVARNYLSNCIILDGDQIIYNYSILAPEFERSGYNAVWTDGNTSEWLMQVNSERTVTSCSRTGGTQGWQLYSISRWSEEDGIKLRNHMEREFESGNTKIYWDDVAMFCHFEDFQLGIREMKREDIIEIDDITELVAIDPSYAMEVKK